MQKERSERTPFLQYKYGKLLLEIRLIAKLKSYRSYKVCLLELFKIIDGDGARAHDRHVLLRQYHRHNRRHHRTNRMSSRWMRAVTMFAIAIAANADWVLLIDLEAAPVVAFLPCSRDRVTIWNTFPQTLTGFMGCSKKKQQQQKIPMKMNCHVSEVSTQKLLSNC